MVYVEPARPYYREYREVREYRGRDNYYYEGGRHHHHRGYDR